MIVVSGVCPHVPGVGGEMEPFVDFIEEFGALTSRRVRHTRSPSWCPEMAEHGQRVQLPEHPTKNA